MTRRALVATAIFAALTIAPAIAFNVPTLRPALHVENATNCTIYVELINYGAASAASLVDRGRTWETPVQGNFHMRVRSTCNGITEASATVEALQARAPSYVVKLDGTRLVLHRLR